MGPLVHSFVTPIPELRSGDPAPATWNMKRQLLPLVGLSAIAVLASPALDPIAHAADHQESPFTAEDPAVDLGDLYAWHTDTDSLVLIMTYAGYAMPSAEAAYDDDVLYTFHVSTDGDAVAEHDLEVRFGQNGFGEWGVSARNVPGEAAAIEGPVEETLEGTGTKLFAGVRDDPFFFDLQGFQETLSTATLSFDSTRDVALLQNTNAIALEIPISALGGDRSQLRVWASTARK